jgi:ABC-type sugar transport system ATPase subunit
MIDERLEQKSTEHFIKSLNIKTPSVHTIVQTLSGGNQQKVVISKWLLTNPSILILDEPTRGVDMATRVDIYQKIDELAVSGISILMVSSDLTEAVSMADRVLVMRNGRVVKEMDAARTSEDEVLAYAIGDHYE